MKQSNNKTLSSYSLISFAVCRDYLGMENGDIQDENIQASSTYSAAFAAWKGRLNGPTSWYDVSSDIFSWIQADIGYQTSVSGVVTQGSGGHDGDYWVTEIKVSTFQTSLDDEEVFIADDNGNDMVISPPPSQPYTPSQNQNAMGYCQHFSLGYRFP